MNANLAPSSHRVANALIVIVMLAFTPLTCGLMGYQPSRWAVGPTHTSRGRAAVSLSANPPSVLCVGECLFDALP